MSQFTDYFKNPKRVAFLTVRIAVVALLFTALFYPKSLPIPQKWKDNWNWEGVSISQMIEVVRQLDPANAAIWVSVGVVILLSGITCGILRWKLLLIGQDIRLPFLYLARCWFMGRAIGLFLPGTIGLDGYRLVESATYTGQAIKCATVVAVEKLIGFIALFLLVFLTLPLGMRLFNFNMVILGLTLFILGSFILTAFLLLLNPRIAQVLVAAVPVPGKIRNQVNTLGTAVTAYAGQRTLLMSAVGLGLCVHLAICLVLFCTAMTISGGSAHVLDVLFASPLTIVSTVFAPSAGGLAAREAAMTALLGGKYGAEEAFLFGHLFYWLGQVLPFLVSIPLLVASGRPDREKLLAEIAAVREETGGRKDGIQLSPEVVAAYRAKLAGAIGAGWLAGAIGAAAIGLAEAIIHIRNLGSITDVIAYWWGPAVYGVVFGPIGLGIAAALVFVYLLFDRFAPTRVTFALCLAGTTGLLGLMIGVFRYRRDVLQEAAMQGADYAKVVGGVVVAATVAGILGYIATRLARNWRFGAVEGAAALIAIIGAGVGLAAANPPSTETPPFVMMANTTAPNIVFVAVDTLRADFLPVYNMNAPATTPNVVALAQDSVVFQNAIAQSSWTKASFGTMFSGLYPEAHTATGKVSRLPLEITTLAEVLQAGGYYTQGFSNNPNITSTFDYNQGFVVYTDLKPDLLFGAKPSCEKLVGYDILRKVYQTVTGRLFKGRIRITDFYQPADRITDVGLAWIDSDARPQDAPFYLFLHYMDPHDPYRDPERPGKGYARVQMANPDPEEYKEAFIRSYVYEIEFMDTHLGRLIDGLKQRGLYDNTLIVFTADHGEEFHEHGGWWHGLSLYDEQIKVPLMLKLPGGAAKGTYINDLARHVDLAPTLARFANLQPDATWQGQPLLTDQLASNNANVDFVHSHLDFEGIKLKSLRSFNRKFIEANEGNKRGYAPVEVYDLIADPGEQHNMAGELAAGDVQFLKDTLTKMSDAIEAGAVAEQSTSLEEMSPADRERMKALGYLGDDETED